MTVTGGVPNFPVSLSDNKLDTMVHPDMTIVIKPIYETGTLKSLCIAGHPEPSKESGNPKLINAT